MNNIQQNIEDVKTVFEALFDGIELEEQEWIEIQHTTYDDKKNYSSCIHVKTLNELIVENKTELNFSIHYTTKLLPAKLGDSNFHKVWGKRTGLKEVYRAKAIILDVEYKDNHKLLSEKEFKELVEKAYNKLPDDVKRAAKIIGYTGGGGQFIIQLDRVVNKDEITKLMKVLKEKLKDNEYIDTNSFNPAQAQRLLGTVSTKYDEPVLARIHKLFDNVEPLSVDKLLQEQEIKEVKETLKKKTEKELKEFSDFKEAINEIKKRLNVIELFNIQVKSSSDNKHYCLCPIHHPERYPSFEVIDIYDDEAGELIEQIAIDYHPNQHKGVEYPEFVRYTSAGNAIFDVIDLYRMLHNKTFKEAVEELSKIANVELPEKKEKKKKERFEIDENDIKEILNTAYKNYTILFDLTQREFLIFHNITNNYKYVDKQTMKDTLKKATREYLKEHYKIEEKSIVNDTVNTILEYLYSEKRIIETVYEPGITDRFVEKDDGLYFNLYSKSKFDDCKRTDELDEIDFSKYPAINILLNNLSNYDDKKKKYLTQWIAYKIKNKGKIGTAIVMFGEQGAGKGLLANQIVRYAISNENYSEISEHQLDDKFNEWLLGKLVIVANEIKIDYQRNFRIQNQIKAYITDELITINRKFKRTQTYTNYADFFIFSNHDDAVKIEPSDRRYFVMKTGGRLADADSGKIINRELSKQFKTMTEFVEAIKKERDEFIKDLLKLKVDVEFLRYNLYTHEKAEMRRKTMSQLELFTQLLREKDYVTMLEGFNVNVRQLAESIKKERDEFILVNNNFIEDKEALIKGLYQLMHGFIETAYLPAVYKSIMNDKSKSDKSIKDSISSTFTKDRISVLNKVRRLTIFDTTISQDKIRDKIIYSETTDLNTLADELEKLIKQHVEADNIANIKENGVDEENNQITEQTEHETNKTTANNEVVNEIQQTVNRLKKMIGDKGTIGIEFEYETGNGRRNKITITSLKMLETIGWHREDAPLTPEERGRLLDLLLERERELISVSDDDVEF